MTQIGRREKLSRTDKLNAEKMKEKNNKKKPSIFTFFEFFALFPPEKETKDSVNSKKGSKQ